jgi:hypothetical protein
MTETSPDNGAEQMEQSENLDQMQAEDTLEDRGVDDVLDEGYSPPESYRGEGFGTTADEALEGESFDQRGAQEEIEPDPYEQQCEQVGGSEVGRERAGRLVDPDEGLGADIDSELVGDDVGIDGAASSAEEAAVHVVDPDLG